MLAASFTVAKRYPVYMESLSLAILALKSSGQLFVGTPTSTWRAPWSVNKLHQFDVRIHSLGEDADGELYVLTTAYGIPVGKSGKLWKIVPVK